MPWIPILVGLAITGWIFGSGGASTGITYLDPGSWSTEHDIPHGAVEARIVDGEPFSGDYFNVYPLGKLGNWRVDVSENAMVGRWVVIGWYDSKGRQLAQREYIVV